MRRYLKIKPIAEVGNRKYWLKNYSIDEMRNTSYFWSLFAEVLAQIPEEVIQHFTIDAFEIIDKPTSSGDLNKYREALEQGFHVSVVKLYIRPEP